MTGPNPDAELDQALGLDRLPPAQITGEDEEAAAALVEAWETDGSAGYGVLEHRIAQLRADAVQLGAARVLVEHGLAGAPVVDEELAGTPDAAAPGQALANVRRLAEKHGIPPADGNGVIRSTVAMVEELALRRPH